MIIKDKSLTISAIFFVIIIFILQTVLIGKLYRSKLDLLEAKINNVVKETYATNLNQRMEYSLVDQNNYQTLPDEELDIASLILGMPDEIPKNMPQMFSNTYRDDLLSIFNIALEQSISKKFPLRLHDLNLALSISLKDNGIQMPYDVVLFNPKTNSIVSQTDPKFNKKNSTFSSDPIALNFQGDRVLKIYLNTDLATLYNVGWMLILSFIFSVFCIYCLYYQISLLLRQQELVNTKNSFFSEVSHEMLRPLSIITQALDSLRNEKTITDAEKRSKYISFAEIEIDKMVKKTDMILSLARDDEGIFELNIKKIDLVKLVYDEVDSVLLNSTKSIDLDVDNQLKNNPFIYADLSHLQQVLSNLIGNSIKYSGSELILVIKIYRNEGNVFISVKDNGYGIAKENLDSIFQKFIRANNNAKQKGYGIGLNYVKRVVNKHGGNIIVKSVLNKGSEFIIRLPQHEKQ